MVILKKQLREALKRLEKNTYGDPYGSEKAVPRYEFLKLQEEVSDIKLIVQYLIRKGGFR